MTRSNAKQVVILGGGFAGVTTARELQRLFQRDPGVEVHLVSDENYFLFQPLLPEIVSCGIEPGHILNPIRHLCPGVHFHCAAVQSIDTIRSLVSLTGSDPTRSVSVPYDHLVICLGLRMDLSRIAGMTQHSIPIKTLGDAFHLRNHILSKLEQADMESDDVTRKRKMTFAGVGGGFSGVETVAAINDMIKSVLRYYPRASSIGTRVVLVHSRDRILNELDSDLAEFAQQELRRRGVELILGVHVKEATPTGIVLSDGRGIEAETVVSTVGNSPHPMIASASLPSREGRITVDASMRIIGSSNLWALGDCALVPDHRKGEGKYCPPTAQYAIRQSVQCARNVAASLRGEQPTPFSFQGIGQMAIIGHRCGVASIRGVKLAGVAAWLLWRGVYWSKLPGWRCKIRVAFDWALDLLFPRDITKIALDRTTGIQRAHYRQGDIIVRQGEIGDRFYIIESGEVEVLQRDPNGFEQRVAVRAAGDTFGEIALLRDAPRNATVRCLSTVNVLTFSRREFHMLVEAYPFVRSRIQQDAAGRGKPGGEGADSNSPTSAHGRPKE